MQDIRTDRLIIRAMRETDAPSIYEYLSDPETYLFEPGAPIGLEDARATALERSKGLDFLAVERREDGRMIGHLYFKRIEPREFATWELGYIFNKAFRGKGYASEASRALVELALTAGFPEGERAHRVVAFCDTRNAASWRLLERIGMRREAERRRNAFFRRDARGEPIWHDSYQYAMLAEDLRP